MAPAPGERLPILLSLVKHWQEYLGVALMKASTEHVRLRVLVDNVTCSDVAIPKGDYDGYIDWEHPDETEPRMTSVQLIPDAMISNLPCEVLRYLRQGDIERIDC
jgi:hypothetical protein